MIIYIVSLFLLKNASFPGRPSQTTEQHEISATGVNSRGRSQDRPVSTILFTFVLEASRFTSPQLIIWQVRADSAPVCVPASAVLNGAHRYNKNSNLQAASPDTVDMPWKGEFLLGR